MTSTCLRDSGEFRTVRLATRQRVAQRRVAAGAGEAPGKLLQRRGIKRPELDRLPRAVAAEHEQPGLDFPGRAAGAAGSKGLDLLGHRRERAVGDDVFGRRFGPRCRAPDRSCCRRYRK